MVVVVVVVGMGEESPRASGRNLTSMISVESAPELLLCEVNYYRK